MLFDEVVIAAELLPHRQIDVDDQIRWFQDRIRKHVADYNLSAQAVRPGCRTAGWKTAGAGYFIHTSIRKADLTFVLFDGVAPPKTIQWNQPGSLYFGSVPSITRPA